MGNASLRHGDLVSNTKGWENCCCNVATAQAVTLLSRITFGLFQPLLLVLLLAGLPTHAHASAAHGGDHARVLDYEAQLYRVGLALAGETIEQPSLAGQSNGDGGGSSDPLLGASPPVLSLDFVRSVLRLRASCLTALPTRSPCAAPPTGPPSLV
jgi:hypothetical protein